MRFSSSDVCKMTNVTKKALRHYNKIGLLSPSEIDSNGYWYYDEGDLDILEIIKNLQIVGYSLKEIKDNLNNDCKDLRQSIPEKLQYIEEQLLQLNLSKNLLKKISLQDDLSPIEAIKLSLDQAHMDWFQENLTKSQYKLVIDMMNQPDSLEDHNTIIRLLKDCKPAIKSKDLDFIFQVYQEVYKVFNKYKLTQATSEALIIATIQSNLEGPMAQRILTLQEASYLLSVLNK